MSHVRECFGTYATRRVRTAALGAAALTVLLGLVVPAAQAANGTLPGGTPISVNITNPATNGTTVPSPPGNVNLAGNASIGQGAPTAADTTLIYVVDRSQSTDANADCGGNQNGDALSNTVLDCEIAAGRALNQAAISAGSVDEVGVVFFAGNAAIQDSGPATPGTQGLTAPATDANGSGTPDVEETLRTAQFAALTNFEAAVQQACSLVQQSTNTNNIVVFLSDGFATSGGNAVDDVPCAPKTATFQTFAIGSGSNCDGTGQGRGSLRQIATATGGTCTRVVDVSTLPDILPGIIKPRLTKLELTIDGGTPININANATPPPPLEGPATLTYTRLIEGLTVGTHTLCVKAFGMDSGGSGSIQACRTVIVASPAKISINDVIVNEGNAGTTTPAVFTVSLSAAVPVAVTVKYATANNTATAGSDYVAKSGTVTFPANVTSQNVTITVNGDNVNENDETFFVNLSAPTNATILDAQGKGTILDDERNGAFSCRASALNLLGLLEPVVANAQNNPCRDATGGLISAVLNVVGLTVGASVPNAKTDQTPNDLSAPPAIGDRATAHADLATASISLAGIGAQATDADAKAECTSSGVPKLSTSGKVVGLRVNGRAYNILTEPVTIPLLLATLRINNTTVSGTSIRRRAIWLDNLLLPDVIIGEAIAGYSGNPCDA
jgi:hypothetical protein